MNGTLLIMLVGIAITTTLLGMVVAMFSRASWAFSIKASERRRLGQQEVAVILVRDPTGKWAGDPCSLGLNLCTTRQACIAVPKPMVNRWTTVNETLRTVAIASSASGLSYLTMR
jgi:hypothetical protein